MTDEFVRREVTGLTEPKGRLLEILTFITTLPMHLPKPIVEKVARMAYISGFTEVAEEMAKRDNELYTNNVEGMNEMKDLCEESTAMLRDSILTDVQNLNTPGEVVDGE